jgi:hypothetical protein
MWAADCDGSANLFKNKALAANCTGWKLLARGVLPPLRLLSNGLCWSMIRASRPSPIAVVPLEFLRLLESRWGLANFGRSFVHPASFSELANKSISHLDLASISSKNWNASLTS